jgi:hypothetical protein
MDTVAVTLRGRDQEIDLELPVAVPLFVLAPILAEKLGWSDLPLSLEETRFVSAHVINSKMIVRPTETLGQAGVVDGDILELAIAQQPLPAESNLSQGKGTYLQCRQTGEIFNCRGRANIIGRLPSHPISLHHLPGSDAVSRTHANLLRRDDDYWLKDERSTNGTIVDGYMLKPGETVRLRRGSLVQFGLDGPVLVFHAG